ncbi:MAG: OpgC domain-containing protein [Ignavibacteriales bacterium]|nr:OpgC domain-containing protein [Ignavibacteriales bacterium]MCB9210978.1 OpgC domain-containing protein [Ignavibacteriales bacterium]
MTCKRNYTLDIIRGLLLIVMTIDHFSYQIMSYNFGYFSAAEGFVFVSGLVMGIYGINKYYTDGFIKLKSILRRRSFKIYKYHIFSLLFFFLFSFLLKINQNSFSLSTLELFDYEHFLWGLLLVYSPNYLDILPMYIFFVLISPYIIDLIIKKKIGFILVFSIFLWLGNYLFINSSLNNLFYYFQIPFKGVFSVLSWQFLFVLGILSSSLYKTNIMNKVIHSKLTIIITLSVASLFFFQKHEILEIIEAGLLEKLTARSILGPLTIINFLAVSYIVFYSLTIFDIKKYFIHVGMLGSYSIQVFTFHVLLIIVFRWYIPLFSFELFEENYYINLILNDLFNWALTLPIILLLFLPVIFITNQQFKLILLHKLHEIKILNFIFYKL